MENGAVTRRAVYTPVRLMVEYLLECEEGKGMACLERDMLWPGMPQHGQGVEQNQAPWFIDAPLTIEHMLVDIDEQVPRLRVFLDTVELHYHIRAHQMAMEEIDQREPSREFFIECVELLLKGGWQLSHAARWLPHAAGEPEELTFEQFS